MNKRTLKILNAYFLIKMKIIAFTPWELKNSPSVLRSTKFKYICGDKGAEVLHPFRYKSVKITKALMLGNHKKVPPYVAMMMLYRENAFQGIT